MRRLWIHDVAKSLIIHPFWHHHYPYSDRTLLQSKIESLFALVKPEKTPDQFGKGIDGGEHNNRSQQLIVY